MDGSGESIECWRLNYVSCACAAMTTATLAHISVMRYSTQTTTAHRMDETSTQMHRNPFDLPKPNIPAQFDGETRMNECDATRYTRMTSTKATSNARTNVRH